jgi:pilus assembly protein CpaE
VLATDIGIVIETKELWQELRSSLDVLPVRIVFEQVEIGDWPNFAQKVERMRPEVLFLDVTKLPDVLDAVRRIKSFPASPAVIALHTEANSSAILEALRGGVSEYLYPPFGETLQKCLERLSIERRERAEGIRPGGKILNFLSAKGGCGATTVVCHTASELRTQPNTKVLLGDLDLDAGMVAFLMKQSSPYSVLDALSNLHRLDASYWKALISNGIPGLEMISAPAASAVKQPIQPNQIEQLFRFLRLQYDWSLIDLGRGLNHTSLCSIQSSDQTYVVTTAEIGALHQAKQIVKRLLDSGYSRENLRLILNRPPKRFDVTLTELERMLGASVFATIPNDYHTLNEAYAEGKLTSSGSLAGRGFAALANKIAGVTPEKTKRMFSFR